MKIHHGRYYYDFLETVEKLKKEDNSCYICHSTKDVSPHHIARFKESDKRYADKSNVVLLCKTHHKKFHNIYGSGKGVNLKNFKTFCRVEQSKGYTPGKNNIDIQNSVETLKKENNIQKNTISKLQSNFHKLKNENEKLKDTKINLQNAIKTLQNENNRLNNRNIDLQNNFHKLKNENEKLKDTEIDLQNTIKTLKKQN